MNQRNTAASVRARLLTRARETRQDFNLVLTRYALERLLYRLSVSPHADQFLLKGALLFDLWFDIPHRPTRDADLLGFGSAELPHLEVVFKDVCTMETDDGVTFRPDTVQAAEIRMEANYAGVRVTLLGLIDGARCPIQVDIGFGDAVTPGPEDVQYPVMLSEFAAQNDVAPGHPLWPDGWFCARCAQADAVAGVSGKEQTRSAAPAGRRGIASRLPASSHRGGERSSRLPATLARWWTLVIRGGVKRVKARHALAAHPTAPVDRPPGHTA